MLGVLARHPRGSLVAAGTDGEPQLFVRPRLWMSPTDPAEALTCLSSLDRERASGVAAGWFGYEFGGLLVRDPRLPAPPRSRKPWFEFGVYDGPADPSVDSDWLDRPFHLSRFRYLPGRIAYTRDLRRVLDEIGWGNVYQVNYTGRLRFRFEGDPCSLFLELVRAQPARFSAVFRNGDRWVLSLSPELFLDWAGTQVTMQPMKGTCPRGRFEAEDHLRAQELSRDPKSRAENLMIVDLVRNDLGRVARLGQVRVDSLYATEVLPTLIQMTSHVTARVESSLTLPELLAATYPPGSVTGAPKLAAMQLIEGLEKSPREVYCGALGLLHPGGVRLSVGIRTLSLRRVGGGRREAATDGGLQGIYRGEMGVGSGVVADSSPEDEWRESRLKAVFLRAPSARFELVETLLWQGRARRWGGHLERLSSSIRYFGFGGDPARIEAALAAEGAGRVGRWKLRILYAENGGFRLEWSELADLEEPVKLGRAAGETDSQDPFLFHKTTNRPLYREAQSVAAARGWFDLIFCNREGRVTEGSISNIFARIRGRWVTPPLEDGVLSGVMRAQLIRAWGVREGSLTWDQLAVAEEIVVSNSVRGPLRAMLSD